MIVGAHTVIYSNDAESDRAFLKDIIGLNHVDAGGGWLIFSLPPSEVAVHPAKQSGKHEFYLMCDDINLFISEMAEKRVPCSSIDEEPWGLIVQITLPGGGLMGVYEAKHARPE